MAMNKKEQAEFLAMQRELRVRGALRATSPVTPDVPIPRYEDGHGLSTGFLPSGGVDGWGGVEVACSSSISHAVGRTDRTTSQGSRRLYSTRLLALKAKRYEMEQEFAQRLARIDEQIEAEEKLESIKPKESVSL